MSGARIDAALIGLLLLSTVAGEIKLPWLGVGVQNVLLPGCALLLLVRHAEDLPAVLRRHRPLLALSAGLLAWTAVAALASSEPALGLRLTAKAATYAVPFLAFLTLLARPDRQRAAHLGLLAFLLLLAVGGLLEAAFPGSAPFRLLRTERSLSILPRIAGFQPWPNPFGVAMASGLGLAAGLQARGWLGRGRSLAAQLLFATQAAQSGSRNAWMALGLTLAVLSIAGPARRQTLAATLGFALSIVLLPVPAWQAGLQDRAPVIESLVPPGALDSPSLAEPLQSLSLRSKLWRAAAAQVAQHPWLGIGPGVFSERVAPRVVDRHGLNTHCLPLNLLVELGLPGLALALLALLAALRSGRGTGPAGLPLLALLAGQLLDCFLYDPASVVLLLFLAASMATRRAA